MNAALCVSELSGLVLAPGDVLVSMPGQTGIVSRGGESGLSGSMPRPWQRKTAAPSAEEEAAILDAIAEQIADAIWTDFTGDVTGSRLLPEGE